MAAFTSSDNNDTKTARIRAAMGRKLNGGDPATDKQITTYIDKMLAAQVQNDEGKLQAVTAAETAATNLANDGF